MAGRGKPIGNRNLSQLKPVAGDSKQLPQALVQKLYSIQFNDCDENYLAMCAETYENLKLTKEDSGNLIKLIHSTCLLDSSFSRKIGKFLATLEKRPGNSGHTFRTELLICLQGDFQAKEKLAKSNQDQLLNAVLLHGEIYDSLRILDAPVKVLAEPLLEYMSLVLEFNNKASAQLILSQLAVNGKNLKEQGDEAYDTFINKLRKQIIDSEKQEVSARLLLALELGTGVFKFENSLNKVKTFYHEKLGDDFRSLECRMLGIPFVPDLSTKPAVASSKTVATSIGVPESLNSKMAALPLSPVDNKTAIGLLTDVAAVRERMRSKGLLPRRSLDAQKVDKDSDIYGVQLQKNGSRGSNANEPGFYDPAPEDW